VKVGESGADIRLGCAGWAPIAPRGGEWSQEQLSDCGEKNFQVSEKTDFLAIGEVAFQFRRQNFGKVEVFFIRAGSHQRFLVKIDLRGGDSGPREENALLASGVLTGVDRDFGAWADEAHIAAEDVEELRELVDFGLAKPKTERRDARIASGGEQCTFAGGSRAHAAKFQNVERLFEAASAELTKDCRAGTRQTHGDGDEYKQRAEKEQTERGDDGVEEALSKTNVERVRH